MAPEHEARTRVVYDHESDAPVRRHAVADWGVGEDIFDRMPSRRFTRAERRSEHHEDRSPAESWSEGARDLAAWDEPAGKSRTIVIERSAPAAEAEPEAIAEEAPAPEEPPQRRTVVIKGHPDRLPAARPPRPSRTAVERVGASPDRIVAYAVALGFLLLLIAVLTTGQ